MNELPVMVQGASRGLGLGFARRLLEDGRRVVATCRAPESAEDLNALQREHGARLLRIRLDLTDEGSIAAAAERVASELGSLGLLLNVAGLLHDGALQPEKKLDHVQPESMARLFAINATGPLLVAKHFGPLLAGHGERAVLANLSARVGSIGDDRLGGWYGYRASKAAQNMITRNLAIELGRRSGALIVVALHPGTVATDLSAPFRRSAPRVFPVHQAVDQLLQVIEGLTPDQTGGFFAWDGEPIPW